MRICYEKSRHNGYQGNKIKRRLATIDFKATELSEADWMATQLKEKGWEVTLEGDDYAIIECPVESASQWREFKKDYLELKQELRANGVPVEEEPELIDEEEVEEW